VNFVRSEKKGYRLGVLGVTKNAGATTTAMNLAIAAARGGYSVLYVEVDPGNNALTKLTPAAGDVKSPGANISIYNASLGETQTGGTIGLPSDLEVAASGKDLVIFDFSPVKVSGDAFLIANQLDEMVLLVRANVTKSVDFLQSQQALIDAGCKLVTVTLTRVQDQSDDVSALEQQADVRSITPQA
jgi:Mrp family chromosome partitioning ATPase